MNNTHRLTLEDIPDYAPALVDLPDGARLKIAIVPDDTIGAPWEEHDGHGVVSEWTTRDKRPGEMVLASDGRTRRFYDFAESAKIARREGWGVPREDETPRERARRAALADYRWLRGWCNDEWQWVGVVVTLETPDDTSRESSLWGLESSGNYWREVAAELANELLNEKEWAVSATE
jgi:hypothetical protein